MKNILLLLLSCIPFFGISQTDYELEFNSATQDYVEMPNVSSVIANSTTFSISCWVNPQSNTNHGGIIGFRNNTDADFYLLQMQNTNTIEARFRNSSGANYDILANNILDFGQWQHLAFTYDGSYIRLYKNGVIVDSTAANGTITQTNQSFKLGSLDWGTTGFYLNGRLDEVRLWDVALSQTEINNWMCIPIDLTHPYYSNLMGYWRLNEGTGTTITDLSTNGNNGTLINNPVWQPSTTCFGNVTPQLTYVPDHNFEAYLENNGMGNGIPYDSSVFTSAIDTLIYLDLSFGAGSATGIFDLTGIEDFSALTYLDCSYNQITSLDVSSNIALTYLDCQNNWLTNLNVSQNTALTYLDCWDNDLTFLDVSNNTSLDTLDCGTNQLSSLDVSQNPSLIFLRCFINQITSLDVSHNLLLNVLRCSANQLTVLDVSQNTALTWLACDGNGLSSLNLNQNIYLDEITCYHNQLTTLDLSQNTI